MVSECWLCCEMSSEGPKTSSRRSGGEGWVGEEVVRDVEVEAVVDGEEERRGDWGGDIDGEKAENWGKKSRRKIQSSTLEKSVLGYPSIYTQEAHLRAHTIDTIVSG